MRPSSEGAHFSSEENTDPAFGGVNFVVSDYYQNAITLSALLEVTGLCGIKRTTWKRVRRYLSVLPDQEALLEAALSVYLEPVL